MDKIGRLKGIVSNMKVRKESSFYKEIGKLGKSAMFNYATNPAYKQEDLRSSGLKVWDRLQQHDIKTSCISLPMNGFQELIQLTEEGKLWHYPIDNEQGMEQEKETPFEEHVFLDHLLEGFPKNEELQKFMGLVLMGLSRNHWMTVDRKKEIIQFYKRYFEERRAVYKEAGLDLS